MLKTTRYHQKAAEFRQRAAHMEDVEIRDELLVIAKHYEDLAAAIDAAKHTRADRDEGRLKNA